MLNREENQGAPQFLIGIGVVLVIAGTMMLLYIGVFLINAISEPQSVGLIGLILERTEGARQAVSGSVGGIDFELILDDPISTLLFLILSVWILSAFAGIVRGIISAGTALVGTGKDMRKR